MKKKVSKQKSDEQKELREIRYIAYLGYGIDDCYKLGPCWGVTKAEALKDAQHRYRYSCLSVRQIFVDSN